MAEHVVIHPPGGDRKEKKKIGFRLITHLICALMCLTIDLFDVF
jgi:hypothetical protein